MPASPAAPGRGPVPTGQRLGRYRLAQRIGEGGMGVVHLGVDEQGTAVAVKVLRPHVAGDPEARRRLGREVDSLRRVRHPRVAAVLDADVDGDIPYVVTQFVPGAGLDEHVREHGPLRGTALARLGNGLGEALAAIHAAGVVHRDLKPGNVLLLDGNPVVIDFGIAHVADDVRLTSTGLIMGTPGYLSPELVEGERVTQATDWWGWAATMTFAATGRSPFGRGPMEVVLDRVRRGAADLDGVPAVLVPVLAAALSVDPAHRPAPGSLRLAVAELEAQALSEAESLRRLEAAAQRVQDDAADATDAEVMPFLRPAAAGPPAVPAAAARADSDVTQVVGAQVVEAARTQSVDAHATQAVLATTRVPAPALQQAQDDRTRVVDAGRDAHGTAVLPTVSPAGTPLPVDPQPTRALPSVPPGLAPAGGAVPGSQGRPTPAPPQHGAAASGPRSPAPVKAAPFQQAPFQQAPFQQAPSRRSPMPSSAYRRLPTPANGQQRLVLPAAVAGGLPSAGPPSAGPPVEAARVAASPGAAARARPARTGVLVAWAVALAGLAGILPVYALVVGLASVVLARSVDRTLGSLHRRRYERGVRRGDGARAVASAPWHALAALLVSVPAVVLPLLVGASVAFAVGLASPSGPAPGESIPLVGGALAAAVTAWGGPGGGSVRRGSRAVARAVAPGPTASNVVAGLLVVVALGTFVAAVERGWQPDWTPLQRPPFSADTVG